MMSFLDCFNPCSIGLAIEGTTGPIRYLRRGCFNPCSIGLAIEGNGSRVQQQLLKLFQSLFYWISYRRSADSERQRRLSRVSILVLLD